jgi:hypothetical protein
MIPAMIFRLPLAGLAVAATFALVGCGPDPTPTSNNATPTAANSAASSQNPRAQGGFTGQQVCGLIDIATMTQITGFTIGSTQAEMSGNVAVCEYVEVNAHAKVILEWSPTGKVATEYTKSKGEAVPGLGEAAYWFPKAGQLSVELGGGGNATCEVYVIDLRIHNSDAKGGAILIAQKAAPGMPTR